LDRAGKGLKQIIDISLTITPDIPVWPGNAKVELKRVRKIEEGANSNDSELKMGVHVGTHVDSPFHFLPGEKSVESLALEVLIGPAIIVEIPESCDVINAVNIKKAGFKPGTLRIIFKTRNSIFWCQQLPDFQTDFVGLSSDGAEYLVEQGVKLVGIDYLSIAPYKNSKPTHEILLKAGVVILEGANLCHVEPGPCELICLPLKLGGSDGSPARAVIIIDA
jgi:arylformamidase